LLLDGLSQLLGYVCASAALSVVALLMGAWLRRWTEGLHNAAAEMGEPRD
jgi:hypothetical protein